MDHPEAHGGYLRGQIAASRRRGGFEPVSTDFSLYLRGAWKRAYRRVLNPRSLTVDVPPERYSAIEAEIASDESPVGIDAKKTHIVILHMLERIERRLDRLESRMDRSPPNPESR